MIWMVAYGAFLAYAVGLLLYCVRHDRPRAAIGIVLSISGFQAAALEVLYPALGIGVAILGLGVLARDVAAAMRPRLSPVAATRRSSRDFA